MQKHRALMGGNRQQVRLRAALARWTWLCLLLVATSRGLSANISATVDRSTVQVGENLTLSLNIDGASVGGQPTLPDIPGFRLVGTGTQFSFDSARGTTRQTFTYSLAPTQAGDFTIPAMTFQLAGRAYTTQPIPIKVVPPGRAVTAPGAAMPTAFVQLTVPKKTLYVGEVSAVEIRVFFQEGRITQYPQFSPDAGFTVGKWEKPTQSREAVSNSLYNVVTFRQPLIPAKAGLLSVGPATASIQVPDRSRAPDFFFGRPEREVRLATERQVVQVLPVPAENAPPTFAGAVGEFAMAVTAGPTNLAAGDPITVRVQIQGRGALDSLQLPPQPDWNDFRTYPPTTKVDGADENHLTGAKTFEQVVVPERAGIRVLPPLAFTFFDPKAKMFRTLTGPAFALNVAPGSGGAAALPSLPGGTNAAPAQPATDLAHIKPTLGVVTRSPLLISSPVFLAAQLIPPAVWLGLLWNRKRRERQERDPRWRRRTEAAAKVRTGLNELRSFASSNNAEAFFATALRVLQEQIGERVDLPATSITESVVAEKLRPRGAPDPLCRGLEEIFQACNVARYAAGAAGGELTAWLGKVESAVRGLQQWEPQ